MHRRRLLETTTAAGLAALAGCAQPVAEDRDSRTAFELRPALIPIVRSDRLFPVRRIHCIGRNYAAQVREAGSDAAREAPFFFQKPADAVQYVHPGSVPDHPYPPLTRDYRPEVELVVALGKGGRDIRAENALDYVYGYAIGLDMTRDDLQRAMAEQKRPWEIGKSFDRSAPIGPILRTGSVGYLFKGSIWLKVNGVTRQSADLSQMTWNVAELISQLSRASELMPGDLIFSGSPDNAAAVQRGDVIECHIDGLPNLGIRIS